MIPTPRASTPRHLVPALLLSILTLGCAPVVSADGDAATETARSSRDATPDWAGADAFTKPSSEELRDRLSAMQYKVTQHDGTEPPFRNAYWSSKKVGLYVDIVSGEPLFASTHKFRSGTGWPSFWQPVDEDFIVLKEDRSHGMSRVEVRSKVGDSHLGHVFRDGPEPTGLRYCINSASLDFVPVDELDARGYGEYASLFDE